MKSLTLRAKVMQFIGLQALVIVLLGLAIGFWLGGLLAKSFIIGGAVSMIPSAIFSYCLFKEVQASAAARIIARFYLGELIKFVLIGVLFVLAIKNIELNLLLFIIGFIIAQMGMWLAPVMFIGKAGEKY
ncbi:MAG: ATP synthase subunit I [Pseudomonadota bacterium]